MREAALAIADRADDMATGVLLPEMSIEIRDQDGNAVAEVTLNVTLKGSPVG